MGHSHTRLIGWLLGFLIVLLGLSTIGYSDGTTLHKIMFAIGVCVCASGVIGTFYRKYWGYALLIITFTPLFILLLFEMIDAFIVMKFIFTNH